MSPKAIGKATLGTHSQRDRARIVTDGQCVEETLATMEKGGRSKPLPRMALEAIRSQAIAVLESIVDAYSTEVAVGEVGAGGTAKASSAPPRGHQSPTGLLYGRVQSGKTAAMIVTCALAIDNGFRVIVVLTSNNLKLVQQTAERFAVLDGALIRSSLNAVGGLYEWDRDRKLIQNFISQRGAVFVCAKEDGHLKALIKFLQKSGAASYPALILDDEADHATPDTQTRARSEGKKIPHSSTTFRLVVENNKAREGGHSLRESLPHNVFLQVTATPYGLLLQRLTHPLRPTFTRLLHPGQGYTGGEAFFAAAGETASPPMVYVDEGESAELTAAAKVAPLWLQRSIATFLVSASAHSQITGSVPLSGYKYLCHTSAKQTVHRKLETLILNYVDGLAKEIDTDPKKAMTRPEVTWALDELHKRITGSVDLAALEQDLGRHLPRRSMIVVNSDQGAQMNFEGRYNFLVGGNILGRGLTIDDLFVTYYLRQARVTQMDTMHQHARMFGYRQATLDYTRVFLPRTLAIRFRQIHESEKALRDLLDENDHATSITVEVAGDLKATRSNILDIGALGAYRAGQQVYPTEPVHDSKDLGDSVTRITHLLEHGFGGRLEQKTFRSIPLSMLKELISLVRLHDDDGEWDTDALVRVLDATAGRYESRGWVYVRDFDRSSATLEGAISGDEQAKARTKNAPVLFMFRGRKGNVWNSDIWYPTVVFPSDMPAIIFNRDV